MPPASHLHYQCVKITLVSFFVVHWQHAYHQISASLQKMEVHVNSVTYTCSLNKIPKQINIMKQTHNFNQNFALHFLNNKKNTCYTTANMHVVTYIAYITKQYITKPEKFHIELNQKLLIYFVLYHTNLIGPLQVVYWFHLYTCKTWKLHPHSTYRTWDFYDIIKMASTTQCRTVNVP